MDALRSPTVGKGRSPDLAWSAQTWRMSAWLWLNLAAMGAATLHILIDFGIGLFSLEGQLATSEAALLVLRADDISGARRLASKDPQPPQELL